MATTGAVLGPAAAGRKGGFRIAISERLAGTVRTAVARWVAAVATLQPSVRDK